MIMFFFNVVVILMMLVIPQAMMGLIYATLIEYVSHWIFLHGLGRKKDSFFAHHWHGHHRAARLNRFMDVSYTKGFLAWDKHGREFFSVALMVAVNTIVFLHIAPIFMITSNLYALTYLYLHRKMHLDSDWGRMRFPHHYDHHLGADQDKNWGVLTPFWDVVFNTRQKYDYKSGKAVKK